MKLQQKRRLSFKKVSTKKRQGYGLINSAINKLPFELHIPGYNYCGPGTNLTKRLSRGDKGVNILDEACKVHDIAYQNYKDLQSRHKADKVLLEEAKKRLLSKDASLGEKTAALGVAGVMKTKLKFGMGCMPLKKKKKVKKGKAINFVSLKKLAQSALKGKSFKSANDAVKVAMKAVKSLKGKKQVKPLRVIPIPKTGGFLPLIPIFAALGALGSIGGGAAAIAKAVNDAKNAKEQLKENQRHNQQMEKIAITKTGKGLFLKPYKKGYGLFLGPWQSQKTYR